jgi:phosphatidylinositol alpha 1,6-mannosyltransferase
MVTESFLPQVNGVTMSVLRMCEQLGAAGHEVLVVAPGTGLTEWAGATVVRVPGVPVPGYAAHRVAVPWPGLAATLRGFRPDLLHLASPTVLGAQAVVVAERLDLPSIAVYQTDLAAYAARYRATGASQAVWRWLRLVHSRAARTLAPSREAVADLIRHGIPRVHLWPRGVDLDRFSPARLDPALRAELAPDGELLVGYVGRLAAEKQVELLAGVDALPGVRVVIVGDGPLRGSLERALPRARFLGQLTGDALASAFASLDVFAHTGPHETFCQAAQEALASGVPVVAPAAGGLLDLVSEGRNGYLYRPGDGDRLRGIVAGLAVDPGRRAVLAGAARLSVSSRSWDAVGEAYLGHCADLLAGGGPGRLLPDAA